MNEPDHSETAPTPQRKGRLKNGAEAHELTTEDRRKGAARTNEIRSEAAKSFRQRLAEELDRRAADTIDKLLAAGDDDWRAIVAAVDQAFGKPTERREMTGADGGAVKVETTDNSASLPEVLAMLKKVGADDSPDGGGTPPAAVPAA